MTTEGRLPRSAALREALGSRNKIVQRVPVATMSVAEVCAHIGICKTTLYKLIREKKIRSMKVEKRRLFTQRAVQQYMDLREMEEAEA